MNKTLLILGVLLVLASAYCLMSNIRWHGSLVPAGVGAVLGAILFLTSLFKSKSSAVTVNFHN